jgi:hypothetical protein
MTKSITQVTLLFLIGLVFYIQVIYSKGYATTRKLQELYLGMKIYDKHIEKGISILSQNNITFPSDEYQVFGYADKITKALCISMEVSFYDQHITIINIIRH